jgi:hypothetical protein
MANYVRKSLGIEPYEVQQQQQKSAAVEEVKKDAPHQGLTAEPSKELKELFNLIKEDIKKNVPLEQKRTNITDYIDSNFKQNKAALGKLFINCQNQARKDNNLTSALANYLCAETPENQNKFTEQMIACVTTELGLNQGKSQGQQQPKQNYQNYTQPPQNAQMQGQKFWMPQVYMPQAYPPFVQPVYIQLQPMLRAPQPMLRSPQPLRNKGFIENMIDKFEKQFMPTTLPRYPQPLSVSLKPGEAVKITTDNQGRTIIQKGTINTGRG